MTNTTLEIAKWIMILFAICGAIEGSKNIGNSNHLRMNILYVINNIFSVCYFLYLQDYPYFALYFVFLVIGIRGIINNSNWYIRNHIKAI